MHAKRPPQRGAVLKTGGGAKYTLKINAAAVTDVIRKMANWTAGGNWNVPGICFAEENAIVYDVSTAFRPVPKGGGWAVKRQRDAALAETSVTDMSEEADS